jgi:hypothetical protein
MKLILEAGRATLNLRHLNIIPLLFEFATGITGLRCVPTQEPISYIISYISRGRPKEVSSIL